RHVRPRHEVHELDQPRLAEREADVCGERGADALERRLGARRAREILLPPPEPFVDERVEQRVLVAVVPVQRHRRQPYLLRGAPVVALESTIISHGMPHPQNVETARVVERVVRDAGAVPATIAVLHGVPTVGLTDDELELLGSGRTVLKASVRDLPYVIATR